MVILPQKRVVKGLLFRHTCSKRLVLVVLLAMSLGPLLADTTADQPLLGQQADSVGSGYTIPPQYDSLYRFLNASLDRMKPNGQESGFVPMVSSNLLNANSNYLPDIADSPRNLTTVAKTLVRFVDIGLKVVDITIQYPTLVDGFPRSQEYLDYYKKVFAEVRKRNLKITVEVGSTFVSPMFAKLPVKDWYAGLTRERFCKEKRQMVQTIIDELAPDYMTLEEEPTTQHANLGLSYTVEDVKYYVDYVLDGLETRNIPIGAGAGLWDDPGYWDLYLNNPKIDFIDFHIYPISDPKLESKLADLSKRATDKGKKVVVGEAWLYKTSGREDLGGPVAMGEAVFARDAYSFWQPLDSKFIDTLMAMASQNHWEFVSFFWSKCFFGYVDFGKATMKPEDAYALQEKNATLNIYKGVLTETGRHLKEILHGQYQ